MHPNASKSSDGDAFVELQRASILGKLDDPKAQFRLAEMYRSGRGCTADLRAAYRWLVRSAEQGYPRLFGIGVEPSFADAAVYLKRAALGGSVGAQFVLGVFLAHGKLFEPNLRRAQIWLRAAERNGHKRATKELEKITNVLLRKEDEEKERALRDEIESARGASPTLDRLDIVPMRLSDREAQVCHELGLKRGRECAIQGLARYKRILVSKSMLVNDLNHLEALHEFSVNTALRRGLLNPDSLDGIEEICDGTEANVTAWKAAFIDGVEAGIKVGVYGESYEE